MLDPVDAPVNDLLEPLLRLLDAGAYLFTLVLGYALGTRRTSTDKEP